MRTENLQTSVPRDERQAPFMWTFACKSATVIPFEACMSRIFRLVSLSFRRHRGSSQHLSGGSTVDEERPVFGMNRQSLHSGLRRNITCGEECFVDITIMSLHVEEFLVKCPNLVPGPLILLFVPLRRASKGWRKRTSLTSASWRLDDTQRWMFFLELCSIHAVTGVSGAPLL